MLTSLGHEVYLYAGTENTANVTEHIPVAFEPWDGIPPFEPDHPLWRDMNERAAKEIQARQEPGDLLCLIAGRAQQPIAAATGMRTVEFGVGYEGVFSDFRVFESYSWMHVVYGYAYGAFNADGRFYDAVIPNSFEVEDFPLGDGSGGYLLYIGRLTQRKGLQVAGEAAERAGMPLVVAGSGDEAFIPPGANYVGSVGPEQRAELMGAATATLVPTLYVEPFGGVMAESLICGTPVISTDWGSMTENVVQGRDGYRCRTLGEFEWAARHAAELDRQTIRQGAIERFSTTNVRFQYERYLTRVAELDESGGWYSEGPEEPFVLSADVPGSAVAPVLTR